jgi:hypothetical protein
MTAFRNISRTPFPADLPNLFPRLLRALILLLLLSPFAASAQQSGEKDSLTLLQNRRANRTALSSALLPGAGQIMNRKYWKLPILYGGLGALVYFAGTNQQFYKDYKTAYAARIDTDPSTTDPYSRLSASDLQVRKDYYRRNRDLCYILCGVAYILNIVDAYVDAQLRDFDVSDQLSLSVRPGLLETRHTLPAAGFRFTLTLP